MNRWIASQLLLMFVVSTACADWKRVYYESFDKHPVGTRTTSKQLSHWEGGSAAGVIAGTSGESAKTPARTASSNRVGRYLRAASSWKSFNQGPILNLDLTPFPHDRVRIHLDLYTFGDWRGLQQATGGPQHRLMFFDSKASPRFAFDTNFSTNAKFEQSWPKSNPARNAPLSGAEPIKISVNNKSTNAHRWQVEFDYPTDSPSLRFAILCGAGAGSGAAMPQFGIDNVQVFVRSTAPSINLNSPRQVAMPVARGSRIDFRVDRANRRVSLGVFTQSGRLVRTLLRGESLAPGKHSIYWDGLDHRGKPQQGKYTWRSLTTPGFTARYVTTIGINPPGGEGPVPRRSWVGDHIGAGIVDVDPSGIYVGSPATEGMMMLAKVNPAGTRVLWTREQFYQSGRLTRAAASGKYLFMLHPNGKLRRLNQGSGRVEAEWQIAPKGKSPVDVDALGGNLVVADQQENRIRWLSPESGKVISQATVSRPSAVAVLKDHENGSVAVASGQDVFIAEGNQKLRKAATLSGKITAMDSDPSRKELWVVVNGHQVVRLNQRFEVEQTYSDQPRELGPFDPTRFAGVYDIAADLNGGFFVGEPGHPPRRIAHLSREGALIKQWFGGMSFYIGATFDPADPSRLYGIAPEGSINVYKIDYEKGTWEIEACYSSGRLGDSLFPFAGAYKAVRRHGQLYLYHRVLPAVLRLDEKKRKAIPVAIAGRVINRGRTFFQFAGSGRDGYPKPWVAAAEHYGYRDLKSAPSLYSWADANGNGEFEPAEFRFYPDAKRGLSFHNPGDFTAKGDYIGAAKTNEPHALLQLPVSKWVGPQQAAPRWDWDKLTAVGKVTANTYGYGSPRGLSVGPDGAIAVAYQAGIMIRAHGQFEGGGWPEAGLRGARVLGFDRSFQPTFTVGRQSKRADEANSGVLFYPMQTAPGPNGTVIVNDQTKQPAQVWTREGLYVGGFLDGRVDDGLSDGFYRIHGDDNQGATFVKSKTGKHYWLMPYQGHNRLYEIQGWTGWQRQSGTLSAPGEAELVKGTGLTARYYRGKEVVHEALEDPVYFEQFGAERHPAKVFPHSKVVWTGSVAPPFTDRYRFTSLLGKSEQVAVWVDGQLVHASGFPRKKNVDLHVDLVAGHRHQIRVEYINPEGRAELKLLWSSRVLDPTRLPIKRLYPK